METAERELLLKVLSETLAPPPKSKQAKVSQTPTVSENWRRNKAFKTQRTEEEIVCMDCEMVSTEADPNALARVSIVSEDGSVLLDDYVRPDSFIKNFKTHVSGIKPGHMRSALPFDEVRSRVLKVIEGKVVVGHALHNDLRALKLELPPTKVRDTQKLCKQSNPNFSGTLSLKKLAMLFLGKRVQKGSHSSIEDARTTLEVFKQLEVKKQFAKLKRHKDADI
jgi:DNA polymerase III epsilon subunit-like protein